MFDQLHERQKLARRLLDVVAQESLHPAPREYLPILTHTLFLTELRCLDLIDTWRHDPFSHEGREFMQHCSLAFDIYSALPPPDNDTDHIIYTLTCIAYGLLAARKPDIDRYFLQTDRPIPSLDVHPGNWSKLVLSHTANAYLHLIRRNDPGDVSKAIRLITELRALQSRHEDAYLQQQPTPTATRTAAFELIALYHFAKTAELIGEFFDNTQGPTSPDLLLHNLHPHVHYAMIAADHDRHPQLTQLLHLMRYLPIALTENP